MSCSVDPKYLFCNCAEGCLKITTSRLAWTLWLTTPTATSPSRIAEAILTLRTMALSTYENRRVTTGAIIVGQGTDQDPGRLLCHARKVSPGAQFRRGVNQPQDGAPAL